MCVRTAIPAVTLTGFDLIIPVGKPKLKVGTRDTAGVAVAFVSMAGAVLT
ncbi:MAG: hypothetical protein ABW174_06675 [Flavitalea sp.]